MLNSTIFVGYKFYYSLVCSVNELGSLSVYVSCFLMFAIVISFFMAHYRDGTSDISRYVYGLFRERMRNCCCL